MAGNYYSLIFFAMTSGGRSAIPYRVAFRDSISGPGRLGLITPRDFTISKNSQKVHACGGVCNVNPSLIQIISRRGARPR